MTLAILLTDISKHLLVYFLIGKFPSCIVAYKVVSFNCKLFFVLTKLYNRSEHLLFQAVLLMNSGVTDTETIRPENREELILCRI